MNQLTVICPKRQNEILFMLHTSTDFNASICPSPRTFSPITCQGVRPSVRPSVHQCSLNVSSYTLT